MMPAPFSFAPDDQGQAAPPIDYRQFMRANPWGSWAPQDVASMLPGQPQRQSRMDILRQGLDSARDYLTPGYFRDTPSSPQADRALADPNALPGKIGPPSGPPTGMQIAGGLAGDVGLNALPGGKLSAGALAKWLAANGIPWKPAEVETLQKMVNAGALDMDQLPGRTKLAANNVMSKLGLSLTQSPNYVDPRSIIANDPRMNDRLMEMLARGNMTVTDMANDLGVKPSAVEGHMQRVLGIDPQDRRYWSLPEIQAELKQDAKQGYSLGQIASKHGKNVGNVSREVAKLRESGEELPAPMGGTRTPSMPQLRIQADPPPEIDASSKEWTRLLNAHFGIR